MYRKLNCLFLLILLLGLATSAANGDIASDLLGYWTLDGNGNDSSGNGYDGELFGDPSFVPGQMGEAMECLGEQSVYIEDFTGIQDQTAVTTSMWVRADQSGGSQVMWFVDEDNSYGRVRARVDGETFEFRSGDGSGNPNVDTPVITGEWTHLAAVRQNGVKLELFVNGESVDETTFGTAGGAQAQISFGSERRSSTSVRDPFYGLMDECRIYTRALSSDDIKELFEYRGLPPVRARNAQPADGSNDIPRDGILLSWIPGDNAEKHHVYFGETFMDVNNADLTSDLLISEGQLASSLALDRRLEFEKTYFWRVDEVSGAPDLTVYKGHVWSFEVEPMAIPLAPVAATASSSSPGLEPENTINGSGLNADGTHSTEDTDMWVSSQEQALEDPVFILYEFENTSKLHELKVWNSNQSVEKVLGFGMKDVIITFSTDGVEWTRLGGEEGVVQLDQAPGNETYSGQSISLDNVMAKFVKLTGVSNWSPFFNQYSLSEVQFSAIPLVARAPNPAPGTQGVDPRSAILSWRAGREAGQHDVFVSTDPDAMGSANTIVNSSLDLNTLDLSLDTTYFWQVNEVNEASDPSTSVGPVWDFATLSSFVVDDFESYNNISPDRPFQTWIDGFGFTNPAPGNLGNNSGSGIGHDIWSVASPYFEDDIMETGSTATGNGQSMPVYYDNSGANGKLTYSQVDYTVGGQDWTVNGLMTLSIPFRGTGGNTGTLYAKINNTKIPYDLAATDIGLAAWQVWNIDLTIVNGGVANVQTLSIGIDGANASGVIYLDDINLYAKPGALISPVAPDTAGLKAQYTFTGNASDSSGNGLNGSMNSGLAQVVSPGASGQGSALGLTPGGYVDLGNPASLDFGTGDWTIAAWFKTSMIGTGDENKGTIVGKGGDGTGGHRYALILSETNEGRVTLVCDDNATKIQAHSNTPVNDDQWHFAVGQRQGTDISIYIDGQLEATETADSTYDLSGTSQHNAYIGAITNNGSGTIYKMFNGSIDEVVIYGRALSAEEILWLAGRTTPIHKPF